MRPVRTLVACLALATLAGEGFARTGTGPGGYIWKDCEEIDGPLCDYVIAAVSDGSTGLCSEEVYAPPGGLGFSFPFYGTTFSSYSVSANGIVYLSNAPGCCDDTNAALTGLEGRPMIAPLWDDWAMDNDDPFDLICATPGCANSGPLSFVESFQIGSGVDGGGVRYREIEWFDTAHHRPTCSEPETATFGVRLYEDGRILFNYLDVTLGQPAESDAGIGATVGVSRGFLGEFTQVSFNTATVPYVPYAILFIPPCSQVACNSITAPAEACEGASVTFRANTAGGVAPVEISWDFDGDTIADATGNPVNRALAPGTHVVTAMARDSCTQPGPTTCSVSRPITIRANPVPVITPLGSTTFCGASGESLTLVTDTGHASYQWARNGTDIPAATTFQLTVTTSGDYTVRVVDAFGCSGTSAPITVDATDCTAGCTPLACDRVDARPSPACEGQQVTMTAIVSGGEGAITVAWDTDGDTVPDATGNPLRRVMPPGTTTVTAFVTDSCTLPAPQACQVSGAVIVNVTPSPVATPDGPTTFCAARGESVTLDAGTIWSTWQWTLDGADIPGERSQQLVVSTSGSYTVRVTDPAGCAGESLPVVIVADDCPSLCPPLACGTITVTPAAACEGVPQELVLSFTGGVPPVGIAWDYDLDGTPDDVGNGVMATLAPGTHRVRAVAADSCADPAPQTCDAFVDVIVEEPASWLAEVSGAGDPPLLVLTKAARLEVGADPFALGYHAYADAIGSWWAPADASGRACAIASAGPGARPGTVLLDVPLPANSWVVIASANRCGEGPAGTASDGTDRASGAGWQACGAIP